MDEELEPHARVSPTRRGELLFPSQLFPVVAEARGSACARGSLGLDVLSLRLVQAFALLPGPLKRRRPSGPRSRLRRRRRTLRLHDGGKRFEAFKRAQGCGRSSEGRRLEDFSRADTLEPKSLRIGINGLVNCQQKMKPETSSDPIPGFDLGFYQVTGNMIDERMK